MCRLWGAVSRIAVLLFIVMAWSAAAEREPRLVRHVDAVPGEYIVGLAAGTPPGDAERVARELAATYEVQVLRVYRHALTAFHAGGAAANALRLAGDARVAYVEENARFDLAGGGSTTTATSGGTDGDGGWTLRRIAERKRAPLVNGRYPAGNYQFGSDGTGVHVYVIDTGITASHTQFVNAQKSRVERGISVISGVSAADAMAPCQSSNDQCDLADPFCGNGGHGTAVASLIGGRTFGVAPGVTLIAVKAAPCGATTMRLDSLVQAFEAIVADLRVSAPARGAVINISAASREGGLGADASHVPALHAAIASATNAGAVTVAAAGNTPALGGYSSGDACQSLPAQYAFGNENVSRAHVITVSGTDHTDTRRNCGTADSPDCGGGSEFGFGRCVDIFAPATQVRAAHIDGGERQAGLNGTSWAAPHVAGAVARLLSALPLYDRWQPWRTADRVWRVLRDSATRGEVLQPGAGSPNRLLYIGGVTIARQPRVVRHEGSNTVVEVEAVHEGGTLSYQWYNGPYDQAAMIHGATSPAITVSRGVERKLWVRVTEMRTGVGTFTSDSQILKLTPCSSPPAAPPRITAAQNPDSGRWSLSVDRIGSRYEWYSGPSGDETGGVIGTLANLEVEANAPEKDFWVRIVDSSCTIDSETVTVAGCAPPPDALANGQRLYVANDPRMSDAPIYVVPNGEVAVTATIPEESKSAPSFSVFWRDRTTTISGRVYFAPAGSAGEGRPLELVFRRGACQDSRFVTLQTLSCSVGALAATPSTTQPAPAASTVTYTVTYDPSRTRRVEWRRGDPLQSQLMAVHIPGSGDTGSQTFPASPGSSYWIHTVVSCAGREVSYDRNIGRVPCSDCRQRSAGRSPVKVKGTPTTYYEKTSATEVVTLEAPGDAVTGARYEWREGDATNATAPLFATAYGTTRTSPGKYWVRTVFSDNTTSDSLAVELANPPAPTAAPSVTLKVTPSTRYIGVQQNATMEAVAANFCNATLKYEWFDRDPSDPARVRLTDTDGNDRVLFLAAPPDTVTAWVLVTGAATSACPSQQATAFATVVVACEPPASVAIQTNPLDRHIGNSQFIGLHALGFGKQMTYTWYAGSLGDTSTPVGQMPSLARNPTTDSTYWVRGEDSCGNVSSAEVKIWVCRPALTPLPQNVVVTSGTATSVTINGTLAQNGQTFTVQWQKGDLVTGFTDIAGATSRTYNITQSGQYRAVVRVLCGDSTWVTEYSTVVTATMCYPPAISGVTNASVEPGKTGVVTVNATGTNLTYQWYRGVSGDRANPIANGITKSLDQAPTTTTNYWCLVTSDGNCSTASPTATIDVCSYPSITTQPADTKTRSGSSATLTVAASGASSYKWYRGASGDRTTEVGTGATLNTPVVYADTYFWADAINGLCRTPSRAALVYACTLEASVNNARISKSQSATLTASVSGHRAGGSMYYSWHIGTAGDTSRPHTAGPTAQSILVAPQETTKYWVRVSDGTCTRDSNTATVEVCIPQITTQPTGGTIAPGGYRDLVAATDIPGSTIQWLDASTNVNAPGVSNQFTYRAAPSVSTYYFAWVTSPCGEKKAVNTVLVSVCAAPAVTVPQTLYFVQQNYGTTISVNAQGTNLTYQWYRGASGDTANPLAGETSSSMSITPVSTTQYWCRVVSDGVCATNSATITVDVCTAPQISAQPASVTIPSGSSTTLSVSASSSTGSMTYQWYRGASGDPSNPISGATSASYPTGALTATTSYWVQITRGACKSNSNTATVTVCTGPAISVSSQPGFGGCTTISVTPSDYGAAELSYDWYQGPSGNTSTPLGAGSYYRTVCPTTTTQYWVRVWNPEHTCYTDSQTITVY